MRCHSCSGQPSGLLFQKNNGRRHDSGMEPQRRGRVSPLRKAETKQSTQPEEHHPRSRECMLKQWGLNAETRMERHSAEGEVFLLTFHFIGLADFRGVIRGGPVTSRKQHRYSDSCFNDALTGLASTSPTHFLYRGISSTGFLHALEHGTKEPCLNTLDVLAKSFDMSISELMRGV
jgi:hypothetical protein